MRGGGRKKNREKRRKKRKKKKKKRAQNFRQKCEPGLVIESPSLSDSVLGRTSLEKVSNFWGIYDD